MKCTEEKLNFFIDQGSKGVLDETLLGHEIEINYKAGSKYNHGTIRELGSDSKGDFLTIILKKPFKKETKHKVYFQKIAKARDWHFVTDKFNFRFKMKKET